MLSIEDLPADHFTAEEWRKIAVMNHRAKTYYYERMVAICDELDTTLDVLSAARPG